MMKGLILISLFFLVSCGKQIEKGLAISPKTPSPTASPNVPVAPEEVVAPIASSGELSISLSNTSSRDDRPNETTVQVFKFNAEITLPTEIVSEDEVVHSSSVTPVSFYSFTFDDIVSNQITLKLNGMECYYSKFGTKLVLDNNCKLYQQSNKFLITNNSTIQMTGFIVNGLEFVLNYKLK